jgi:hypothetical protein
MASKSSRLASGTKVILDSSKRPRYCSSRSLLNPKKSGVQTAS